MKSRFEVGDLLVYSRNEPKSAGYEFALNDLCLVVDVWWEEGIFGGFFYYIWSFKHENKILYGEVELSDFRKLEEDE